MEEDKRKEEEERNRQDSIGRVNDLIQRARAARNIIRATQRGGQLAGRAAAAGGRAAAAGGRALAVGAAGAIGSPVIIAVIAVVVLTILIAIITQTPANSQSEPVSKPGTAVKANIKFRCQYDPRWTINSCNITHFGCDPTALSSIMASFGDTTWNPLSVAQVNNMGCNGATTISQIQNSMEWIKSQGYTVAEENIGYGQTFDIDLAKRFLDKGYLLLGIANISFRTSGPINSGGHSFVITGVDPSTRNLTVLDPTYCTTDEDFTTRTLNLNDVLCDSQGCGWYYAYAVKK